MADLQEYLRLRNGTDVRGIASEGVAGEEVDLTAERAENIAAAFCLWLKARAGKTENDSVRIAVGHDSRISAPVLSESVLSGIEKTGGTAVFTGLSSTPSMAACLIKSGIPSGLMLMEKSIRIFSFLYTSPPWVYAFSHWLTCSIYRSPPFSTWARPPVTRYTSLEQAARV